MTPGAAEAAIRQIVADQVAAWNAGDGVAYAKPFAAHGRFTNVYGQRYKGHAAFEQRHIRIFAEFFRGTKLSASILGLRMLGTHAAFAEIATEVRGVGVMPPGVDPTADGVLRTQLLQVFERRSEGWQIVAHHNVAVPRGPSP